MPIKVSSVSCPNCGANVSYDGNSKTGKCEFCGAVLDFTEEYGEKKDRIRDDIQDMQIKQIMNDMNGSNPSKRRADAQKAKKTALIIVLCIVGFYFVFNVLIGLFYMLWAGKSMAGTSGSRSTAAVEEIDIDPFAKVEITYNGMSGGAVARISDANIHEISDMTKTISNLENLSNGDTITIKYAEDNVKVGNKHYNFTRTENIYAVSGLEEYLTDIYDVGEEDFETMKKNAINLAISDCESNLEGYVPGTFELCAIYTLVERDYSGQVTIFVVSFDYNGDNGLSKGYFMAEYSNITKLATGEYKINFNPGEYLYTRESYFQGFTLPSGHSTWDATYADVYLNHKADCYAYENYISEELKQK